MVCRDNFFNVKYAIDMAELTESYIKGFVETCFKAGVHEKQAAAMLDLVAESSAMEKSAAGPSFWKGIGQLISGTGNVVGGAGKAVFGSGSSILKPVGKGISWVNDKYMVQPIKHYTKNNNYLAALTHAGVFGALPPALGFTAFQNWRANSDSSIADAINDYIGDPELLVFGKGGSGKSGISTRTYSPSYSSSYTSNASPNNIPGTTSYTPGETALLGAAGASGAALPESVRELVAKRKSLMSSLKSLRDNSSSSASATVRARSGGDGAADIRSQVADLDAQINDALNAHNRQVGINNEDLARAKADAAERLSDARRRDIYQSGVGFNGADKNALERAGNSVLEALGIRDTDVEATSRARDLQTLSRDLDALNKRKDEKLIDVARATSDIERLTGGRLY